MAQKKSSKSLKKQVRDAIRKLTEDGKQITNQAVRNYIGGGAFRDIVPIVAMVKAEIEAKEEASRPAKCVSSSRNAAKEGHPDTA